MYFIFHLIIFQVKTKQGDLTRGRITDVRARADMGAVSQTITLYTESSAIRHFQV